MARTFYLRDTAPSTFNGKWSAADDLPTLAGGAQGWVSLLLSTARGAAATTLTRAAIAGPTNGLELGTNVAWISSPIDQDILVTGSLTINLRMAESSASANCGAQVVVERVDPVGDITQIINSERGIELGTAESAQQWTVTPASIQLHKGDRIRVRVAINDAGGTMAAVGATATLWLNGPTAGASGDSWVRFNETFNVLTSSPAGSELFLTSDPAEVDPNGSSYNALEMWLDSPSGTTTGVLSLASNGWIDPMLWRVGGVGGGNFLEWFTRKLSAFTLADLASVHFRGYESLAGLNASPRAELAVCDEAGVLVAVWAAATTPDELTTSESTLIWALCGDDYAVPSGSRLRLRLFLDDTELNPVAAGGSATLVYNTGPASITLAQTVTELSIIQVAVGQASESDAAQAVDPDVGHRRRLGIASESDAALALLEAKRVTLGIASEVESAHPLISFGAPTGLVATPIASDRIDLSWDPVAGATGYDIERDGVVIAEYVVGNFYSDTGLTPDTTYSYRVRTVV